MTAEIAILNNQAVALAADSAVTADGPLGQKIFNTVNKLFTLSKHEPVGIMVYSSAEIIGVPVETVVKVYRERLGKRAFLTLDEYASRFREFLCEDKDVFPDEARAAHCRQLFHAVIDLIWRLTLGELAHNYQDWGRPTADEAKAAAESQIEKCHDRFTSSPELAGELEAARGALRGLLAEGIDKAASAFEGRFGIDEQHRDLIAEIGVEMFVREAQIGVDTGVVVSGFGAEEIFPRLRSFEFESSFMGVHKFRKGNEADMGSTTGPSAYVAPFAQREMVETFMEGRSSQFDESLGRFMHDFFQARIGELGAVSGLDTEGRAAMTKFFEEMRNRISDEVVQKLAGWTQERHVGPIMSTIMAMPKEELALMAEALVNLTAIKLHSSPSAETVGGPIDVAVISKGDGFVWIKRKHYFEPALNPNFIHNYFRGGEPCED